MTSSLSNLVNNLSKGIYPYEYMDDWENSMKHNYLKKKGFTGT